MGGILGQMATKFIWWTARRCFFRALFEFPPPAKSPAMVLMTSLPPLRSFFGGSSLLPLRSQRQSSSYLQGERLVVRLPRTKQHRCSAWISSSILSFSAWHSLVEWPVFLWYRHFLLRSALSGLKALLGGGISSALRAFCNIFPLPTLKGVYRENWGPQLSRLGSPRPDLDLPFRSFSSFFSSLTLARAWFLNSHSSSNCMNLAAQHLSSSKLVVGCMHKLSAKGPGWRVVSMWCIATSGLRFRILIAIFQIDRWTFLETPPFLGGCWPALWTSDGGVGLSQTECRTWPPVFQNNLLNLGGAR